MTDYINSIASSLKERFSSPVFGNYILAWLLWNWEGVYITLFVDEQFLNENKYEYLVENGFLNPWTGLVLPLISTAFIIFAYPYILQLIEEFSENRRVERENKKLEISQKELVSIEKYSALFNQYEEVKNRLNKSISVFHEQDANFKNVEEELKSQRNTNIQLSNEFEIIKGKYHEHFPLLNTIFEGSDWAFEKEGTRLNVLYSDYEFDFPSVKFTVENIVYEQVDKNHMVILFQKIPKNLVGKKPIECKLEVDSRMDFRNFKIIEDGVKCSYRRLNQIDSQPVNNPFKYHLF